ncbi:hypothetical protein [Comamonas sp.]
MKQPARGGLIKELLYGASSVFGASRTIVTFAWYARFAEKNRWHLSGAE